MIKALFKFDKAIPKGIKVVDTTSNSKEWSGLSPFILKAISQNTGRCVIFENLWQYSKVYKQHDNGGTPSPDWYVWRRQGFDNPRAQRYPMGKGAVPEYSWWQTWQDGKVVSEKLDYVQARKKIYIPIYSREVVCTESFKNLQKVYHEEPDLILLDYDAYDHKALGMTLKDVVNNPKRKCGHSFVLLSLLTGEAMI